MKCSNLNYVIFTLHILESPTCLCSQVLKHVNMFSFTAIPSQMSMYFFYGNGKITTILLHADKNVLIVADKHLDL